MRNAWRVFTRDVGRLARVHKAWIIIIGVIVTPSLYAWFNIDAFWDPYSNTQHINVAIVNLDEGASSDVTGDINVGDELVDQLEQNHELGWQFLDEDEAMEAVRAGTSYAAIIVPPDFSRDFASITSGNFTRPTLKYYVNEKANAIAPKITDVGASTLDTQVNGTFISVVAKAVTEELKNAGEDVEVRLLDAKDNTVSALDDAAGKVGSARDRIIDLQGSLTHAQSKLGDAKGTLTKIDATLADVQTAVSQAQTIAAEAQEELVTFTDKVTNTYVSAATLLADASSKVNASVAKLSAGIERANGEVGTAIDGVAEVVSTNGEALEGLQAILDDAEPGSELAQRVSDAISALQDRNAADQDVLKQLQQLNKDITGATAATKKSADAINSAAQNAATSATAIRSTLLDTIPNLNHAMSTLSASAGAFSSALDAQRTQLGEASGLLTSLSDQLGTTSDALAALDSNLAGMQKGLEGIRTDVLALSTADVWNKLHTLTGLNAEQIAQFMASPVEVNEHVVFAVGAYGAAMAPLFTNLSLWIGAFVLMVIFKLEVDREGIAGVTVRQAYLGRWMLLAAISVFQAVLLCIGTLIIGVQTVNPLIFIGTGVLIGLTYLSIIYALSVCFGYVGKGLCILLVIMQIPGASGLYPIEMMPGFFRALNPFLPFTYGIDAMRETISGFYSGTYWRVMGVLALFVLLSFILGLFLRRRLGNFTLLFNRKIAATQLLVSEDVQIVGTRHRLSQVISALSNGDQYRRDVTHRAQRFMHRYPMLLRLTFVVGLAVMLILSVIASFTPSGDATLLGIWVLCCLLIIGFLVALEYVKQSIQLATEVGQMPESELRHTLVAAGTRRESLESARSASAAPPAIEEAAALSENVAAEEESDASGHAAQQTTSAVAENAAPAPDVAGSEDAPDVAGREDAPDAPDAADAADTAEIPTVSGEPCDPAAPEEPRGVASAEPPAESSPEPPAEPSPEPESEPQHPRHAADDDDEHRQGGERV